MAKKVLAMLMFMLFIAPAAYADIQWGVGAGVSGGNWAVGASVGSGPAVGAIFGGQGRGLFLFNPGLPQGSILGIITNFALWLLAIFGILGVVGFIISGILYLTAAGNDSQMEKAKNALTWSILGVVVGLLGFVVIQAVMSLLTGNSVAF